MLKDAAASLSSSVNSPSFSVSGSVSGSLDSSNDENEAPSNNESSTTSLILTYGGVPVAFSPAKDGESSPTYSRLFEKKSCDYGSIANMKYPIRLEFEAPDFFLSVDRPEIKITFNDQNVRFKYDTPIKIISWKRNQAILVGSTGVIDNYGKPESAQEYYATTAFESRWAWHTSKHFAKSAFSKGKKTIDCSLITDYCSDLVKFKFDESTKYSDSDTRQVPKDRSFASGQGFFRDFNQPSPIINWFSFKGPIDDKFKKGILQVEHDSRIGTLTRINWVKAYYPNSENTWFFDIKGYHIKEFQEPKYHSKEFIEVNFDKYTPKDPFSPFKWYQLYPFNDAATKESIKTRQLYFYHNYNFNIKGVYSYQLDGNYDANKVPSYDFSFLILFLSFFFKNHFFRCHPLTFRNVVEKDRVQNINTSIN
ncbi:hypothetical protein CYY_010283 [Polysphondylium violaceum]|uniref:Uncharacterized protein n=1 Tax=Polysphondylium violaceum TaxID=133409 RepID=A0A8J4PLL2_9MYCE|nr:hypothetical protein CYY_010283 [Polysphondylium violaceum]